MKPESTIRAFRDSLKAMLAGASPDISEDQMMMSNRMILDWVLNDYPSEKAKASVDAMVAKWTQIGLEEAN